MKTVVLFFILALPTYIYAQDIALEEVTNGASLTLSELYEPNGSVVLFTSKDCPFNKYYKSRIEKTIGNQAYSNLTFFIVQLEEQADESFNFSKVNNQNVRYLKNTDKLLAKHFKVLKSPSVVVLASDGSVYYAGAIDNTPQLENEETVHYFRDNLDALIAKKKPTHSSQRPVGCVIR